MAEISRQCEVVIVGAGVAGASAAYHLVLAGVQDVVVLDCGTAGNGVKLQDSTASTAESMYAKCSGSAVMLSASTVKMILQLFATSCEDFISHHGKEGAQRYLKLSKQGLELEKQIADRILPDPTKQCRACGFFYIAYETDGAVLYQEYTTLKELGCSGIEWCDKDRLLNTPGCPDMFHCAIYFPEDAIIDSSVYAASLLATAKQMRNVRVYENCSPALQTLTECDTSGNNDGLDLRAVTMLQDGTRIESKHVVLATGGLFTGDTTLSGILRPCWSYLVSLPHPDAQQLQGRDDSALLLDGTPKFSSNFVTWGFTHDWCWTEGAVRISGEDHFSALKPPRAAERCQSLANWTRQAYPKVFGEATPVPVDSAKETSSAAAGVGVSEYNWQYGVYSETPDAVPIVGQTGPHSRVCYLLGCNALGQAVLSYCAKLVPGLLGYRELTSEEKEHLGLVSIRRFALLPAVLSALDHC